MSDVEVVVLQNGPYKISGTIEVVDHEGRATVGSPGQTYSSAAPAILRTSRSATDLTRGPGLTEHLPGRTRREHRAVLTNRLAAPGYIVARMATGYGRRSGEQQPLGAIETIAAALNVYMSNAPQLWGAVAVVIVPLTIIEFLLELVVTPSGTIILNGHLTYSTSTNTQVTGVVLVLIVGLVADSPSCWRPAQSSVSSSTDIAGGRRRSTTRSTTPPPGCCRSILGVAAGGLHLLPRRAPADRPAARPACRSVPVPVPGGVLLPRNPGCDDRGADRLAGAPALAGDRAGPVVADLRAAAARRPAGRRVLDRDQHHQRRVGAAHDKRAGLSRRECGRLRGRDDPVHSVQRRHSDRDLHRPANPQGTHRPRLPGWICTSNRGMAGRVSPRATTSDPPPTFDEPSDHTPPQTLGGWPRNQPKDYYPPPRPHGPPDAPAPPADPDAPPPSDS